MCRIVDVFRVRGRLSVPLLLLFASIFLILLINAFLHDPTAGYDAQDHIHYIQTLATYWRLPVKAETGQYYSPPLPYLLPAVLTSMHVGLWKALKLAQFFQALLAAGLMLYLLKICNLVAPDHGRLQAASLAMLGLLPVFYRSFALIRGEPYLAFLGIFVAYETLKVFRREVPSPLHMMMLGGALGLAILARQWGFFLFPPVVVFALWASSATQRARAFMVSGVVVLLALIIGGWFYALIYQRYGTLTAFDRAPQEVSAESISSLLSLDANSAKLFSDPVRPSLGGRLLPIFYADTWGDYWGYFLIYARNVNTGQFSDGNTFQKLTAPAQFGPALETNRFTFNHFLGALNVLDLLPSAILIASFLFGCYVLVCFLTGHGHAELDRAIALLTMIAGVSLLGFLWFVIRYQSAAQGGDLVKTTYLLQMFPPLAFIGGSFMDHLWERGGFASRAAAGALGAVAIAELPAFVTHYVHLSLSTPVIVFLASSVLFLGGLVLTYWIHTRYILEVVAKPVPPPADGPLISFCIPARNEENNIRTCIEALLAQTYPNFEVVVLDDRSTDATPSILKELAADRRIRVIQGAELPEGWAGKPHALVQAAAAARGGWLCFVDADTFLAPEALSACYQKAVETKADMFTMLTRQITGTFWEKVVMPMVMTSLSVGFPPREVNDPQRRIAVANGQFILIKRSVYEALGGHERIKDRIVEDKALAELVKWNGYRLVLADGREVARTRMYTSFPQMWEGWTKNIYLGLRDQPKLIFLGAFGGLLLVLSALFLPVWPVLGLGWYLRGGGWLSVMVIVQALLVWTALLYARAQVAHAMRISRWYALTLPLGAGVFAAMMIVSAWKVISGRGVTWRGRRYNPA